MDISVLEVRHLRLVQAIADEGGPTRAAARLHLSQSAVSHQLADLERRLGVRLFRRLRRRLHLTNAGQRVLDFSRGVLPELAQLERELADGAGRARRRLRLSTECFTCYHWLPAVLPPLRQEFPYLDVRIAIHAAQRIIPALLAGELELAIVSSEVHDPSLVAKPLFRDEWVVLLPPSHELGTRRHIRGRDLANFTVFAHEASPQDARRMREVLTAEGVGMPEVQEVPLTDAIVELVKADLGVGLMSRWAVAPFVAAGDVVARRFTRGGLEERWTAAFRRDAPDPRPLERFAELLRARPPQIPA